MKYVYLNGRRHSIQSRGSFTIRRGYVGFCTSQDEDKLVRYSLVLTVMEMEQRELENYELLYQAFKSLS